MMVCPALPVYPLALRVVQPAPFVEILGHIPQVHGQHLRIAVGAPRMVVHHLHVGVVHCAAHGVDAAREVDVFRIQEVAFVEQPHPLQRRNMKQPDKYGTSITWS